MQIKLAEYHNVPIIPISNLSRFNTSFKFPSYEVKVEKPIETDNPKIKNIPTILKFPTIKRQKRFVSSNDSFTSVLDKLAAEDESIAKNKDILSRLAQVESNQRWNARNDRAYGAFQLMDFNITGDVNDFINNPEEQIKQANRLLEFNKSQFTKRDLELAQKQGYSYDQLLAGAWLGGVGSVRKVLNGTGNPSDKDGADVRSRMQKFQTGGLINKWLDDWNKARYNTGRFNDQLGNNQINIQKQNRDNTPVFHSSEERDKTLGITNPIFQRYYNSNLGIVSTNPIRFKGGFYSYKDNFIQIVSPKQREYLENKLTSRLSNQQNQYEYMSPEWQQIEAQKKEIGNIFKTNSYDSQLLHEQSHASKAVPQETKISTIVPTEDEYLDDPSEIYSRLNQLRQYYKLDPNKIYQKSDIKKLKGPGFDILNRYDDKTILRLLNEVANNNTKPELVNYAQKGIKLSKEKLELIDKLRKQGQTYIKADNSTKELKEANNRARRNKQIGENIKSIALNTAEGVTSAVYPAVGAGLAIKNSYNNPIGGIIDAASTALPYLKFSRFKNGKINYNGLVGKGIIQNNKSDIKELTDDIIKQQNEAIIKGAQDMNLIFNKDPNLKNANINGKRFSLYLTPEIQTRANNINWGKDYNLFKLKQDDSRSYIYHSGSNNNFNTRKGWDDIYRDREAEMKEKNWRAATWISKEDVTYGDHEIQYSRYNLDGSIKSPEDLYSKAIHENTHKMQDLYNINYDTNNKISSTIKKYINTNQDLPDNYKQWLTSINEHHGELWRFRIKHHIGSRELTKDEAKQFILENPQMYNKNIINNPPDELLNALIKLASVNLIIKKDE